MDVGELKGKMHSLAFGNAMMAAAEDYKQELHVASMQEALAAQGPAQTSNSEEVDIETLLEDPELERLHAEQLYALQREHEKRAALQRQGHGELQTIEEGEFLQVATEEQLCVCHFSHSGFERCKIMDKHLNMLARRYIDTRFIKISAPDAPFFTAKLQIKMLPCLLLLVNGIAVDRIVGFDQLGNRDDFSTSILEKRLLKAGVVHIHETGAEDSDSDDAARRSNNLQASYLQDEDSDFD